MRLSDFKGEKALDVMVDLMEPIIEIMTDDKVKTPYQAGLRLEAIKKALKGHKKAVLTILALLADKDVEEYEPSMVEIMAGLAELFNDPDVISLFTSQSPTTSEKTSGSATENTEEEKN